jgi:hypothetical protein
MRWDMYVQVVVALGWFVVMEGRKGWGGVGQKKKSLVRAHSSSALSVMHGNTQNRGGK